MKLLDIKSCLWEFVEGNLKTQTALGETIVDRSMDRGSIPLTSTIKIGNIVRCCLFLWISKELNPVHRRGVGKQMVPHIERSNLQFQGWQDGLTFAKRGQSPLWRKDRRCVSIPLTSTTPDPHLIDLKWGFLLDFFSFKLLWIYGG